MLMTVAVVARLGQARRSRSQPGPSMYAKDMMQIVIGVEIGPIAFDFVWVLWHDVLRRVFRHQVDRAKLQKSLFKLVAVCPQDMWLTCRCAYIPICNGQADCSRQDTSRAAARSWNSASRRPSSKVLPSWIPRTGEPPPRHRRQHPQQGLLPRILVVISKSAGICAISRLDEGGLLDFSNEAEGSR